MVGGPSKIPCKNKDKKQSHPPVAFPAGHTQTELVLIPTAPRLASLSPDVPYVVNIPGCSAPAVLRIPAPLWTLGQFRKASHSSALGSQGLS